MNKHRRICLGLLVGTFLMMYSCTAVVECGLFGKWEYDSNLQIEFTSDGQMIVNYDNTTRSYEIEKIEDYTIYFSKDRGMRYRALLCDSVQLEWSGDYKDFKRVL